MDITDFFYGEGMRLNNYLNEKKAELTGDQYKDKFLKQLNKWDTDLSKMTKAYKALKTGIKKSDSILKTDVFHGELQPNGEYGLVKGWKTHPIMKDFLKLRKAFVTFRSNFEHWVFENILDTSGKGSKDESIMQNEVRKTAWQFAININSLFPDDYERSIDKSIPAPWLLDTDYRSNSRKTNITRYQRLWREFKDRFIRLIEYEANKIDQAEEDYIQNVGGVNVLIKNVKVSQEDDKDVKKYLGHIRKAVDMVKKIGLEKAVKDFNMELNFKKGTVSGVNAQSLTAGAYRREDDTLYVFPLGMGDRMSDSTLIHEIGHRYWFKFIPDKAKKEWEDKIFSKNIKITKEHIDKFFDKFFIKNEDRWMYRKELRNKIKNEKDQELKIVFTRLADHKPEWFKDNEEDNRYNDYYDAMIKWHKGDEVPTEWISDYGRTNPAEAFAETFKIWVGGKKGKLGEWTRSFFKRIVATGGANIREEKELIDKYI